MPRTEDPGYHQPVAGSCATGSAAASAPGAAGIGERVIDWMNRCRRATLAEFELVESGSLDVLLYCPDDLAAVRWRADAAGERSL